MSASVLERVGPERIYGGKSALVSGGAGSMAHLLGRDETRQLEIQESLNKHGFSGLCFEQTVS